MIIFGYHIKKDNEKKRDLYSDYRDTRDTAWKVLAENDISELPVNVMQLCEAENIEVYSYDHAQVLIDSLHLKKKCADYPYLVLCLADRKLLLYNDAVPLNMQRFLIASGYGHFVLEHTSNADFQDGCCCIFSSEQNVQVGIFATRLLAPLSVLWGMGVADANEIERICMIPRKTAEKRFERLKDIDARNLERGIRSGQGSLFLSGYERSAYRNFSEYIEIYRRDQ